MELRKTILSLLFVAAGIIAISVFWSKTVLLTIILIGLAVLKHKILPIKREFLWFLVTGILGAGGESIIIFASGVWHYTSPQLLNIPFWLPFLWGLAGTTGVSLYENLR